MEFLLVEGGRNITVAVMTVDAGIPLNLNAILAVR